MLYAISNMIFDSNHFIIIRLEKLIQNIFILFVHIDKNVNQNDFLNASIDFKSSGILVLSQRLKAT